jgi:hypothetical protein
MESQEPSPEQPIAREEPEQRVDEEEDSPLLPVDEKTSPPANPPADEDAVREGKEKLDRAG